MHALCTDVIYALFALTGESQHICFSASVIINTRPERRYYSILFAATVTTVRCLLQIPVYVEPVVKCLEQHSTRICH